ncbi:putative transporter small subunit [Sulfitobacter aestuarii]|uniref:Transporter small subunit n=1 Tax=Sulfitobacter aestuarii TaxID=2161676 RepID=A0ABW5U3V9_9RHOB
MLTFYILIWPVIAFFVLVLIVTTFCRELRQAKRDGKRVV